MLFAGSDGNDAEARYNTISGTVKDASSGETLIGATLFVEPIGRGTVSNMYGYYSMRLEPGTYKLRYSFIGYESRVLDIVFVNDSVINIELQPSQLNLEEVIVRGEAKNENISRAQMSVTRLDTRTIKQIPAFMGETDLIKAIQLLPGVQATAEGGSGFSVRGGSPDQNLILLDEATVYNPVHLMGFFSVFNNDAIKNVELYKGDIPSVYGGRLSSVVDVRIGMTLVVSDTHNAGRYTVIDVRAGAISEIDVLEGFYDVSGDSGLATYPMTWKAGMPRRFSPELEALRQEAIRLRPTYADNLDAPLDIAADLTAVSGNVSSPLKDRLYELRDLLFESIFLGSADVDAGTSSFAGVNFEAQGVEEGDYIVVEAGINTGFYLVTSVTTSSVEVVETNTYTTYSLTNEVGTSLEVWRGSVLSPRSNDLVWYEVINVLSTVSRIDACIRMALHDPNDFIGMGLWERRGDPSDATLLEHRNRIAGRRDWISDSPDLRDAIEGLLAGVEALYDIRYTWIDYRVGLRNGTLTRPIIF